MHLVEQVKSILQRRTRLHHREDLADCSCTCTTPSSPLCIQKQASYLTSADKRPSIASHLNGTGFKKPRT